MHRDRVDSRRRRALAPWGTLLVGLLAAGLPAAAADDATPCASPGLLDNREARDLPLADRLVVRFHAACSRPFVIALDLRVVARRGRVVAERRSAPREFRPGERFLPGEGYLLRRVFPESDELLAALFERAGCGARRVVGSRALAADDSDPDADAHGVACVLVVGTPAAGVREAAEPAGARLAVLLAAEAP
jgi:hypothetical protein